MADPEVNILLVEDTPTDAELFVRSMRQHNIINKVICLGDGAEAIDYLFCRGKYSERDPLDVPGVVLLDLQLPKIDGKEVLRQIKSDDLLRSIPVVVLTSSDEPWEIDECYRAGANSFVQKPIDFDKFAQTVAELGRYWALVNHPPQPMRGASPRIPVSEAMSRNVIWTTRDTTLVDAARMMAKPDVGCLLIAEGDDLIGIVTHKDFTVRVGAPELDPVATRVEDIMTRQVIRCRDTDTVADALRTMWNNRVGHLPVYGEPDRVVGIISMRDMATFDWVASSRSASTNKLQSA